MPKAKYVRESHTTMTEMVLPNDTNTLSNLMGGNLMRLVDIAGAICAQKHSNRIVVTASVDHVSFVNPIPLGNVITLEAQVTRAFNTSMEVVVDVFSENIPAGIKNRTNQAFLTFVAVDQSGRPIEVSEAIPETDSEKVQYERALHRRQLRLLMAGRLNAQDTEELKKTFFPAPSTL
jgi:acyl-CoA hydrolase